MARNNMLDGLYYRDIDWSDTQACEICAVANMVAEPVPRKADRDPGDSFIRGSVDLYGPVSVPSVGGNRYAMIYCDDHNSYGMMEFIADKELGTLVDVILKWKLKARDHGFDLQQLQFDADSIFEGETFREYLRKINISTRYAPPGVHQSNGQVEAMIKTVVRMARPMLKGSGLPDKFWTYAMSYALMIYNVTIKSRFKDRAEWKYKSPYHIVTKSSVIFDFPIFGCLCVGKHSIKSMDLPALESRGRRGVFLGFDTDHHDSAYMLNMASGQVVSVKQVVYLEDYYGYTGFPTDYYRLHPTMQAARKEIEKKESIPRLKEDVDNVEESKDDEVPMIIDPSSVGKELNPVSHQERAIEDVQIDIPENVQDKGMGSGRMVLEREPDPVGVVTRSKGPVRDLIQHHAKRLNAKKMNRIRGILKDDSTYDAMMDRLTNGYDEGYDEDQLLMYMLNVKSRYVDGEVEDVPQTFLEAVNDVNDQKYGDAIEKELKSQFDHEVYDMNFLTELPKNVDCVDSKWVFDIKNVTTGGAKKYKARMTIRGFLQHWLKSYFKTYSPTTQKDSLREILAIAALYCLRTIQIDVKTAFLYGELKEDEVLYLP